MVLAAGDRGGVDYLHPFQGQVYEMVEQAPELSNPVPRFRRRNGNGKNPDGQGFKSGDFFASLAKKYYSSLDRLDSRNGVKYSLVSVSECGIISTAQTDRQDES